MQGIVRAIRANTYEVAADGRLFRCRFPGKMKRDRRGAGKPAAVGDRVEMEALPDHEGLIRAVLPRRNRLARPDPHTRTVEQVIVANVDALLVVHSLQQPDLDLLTIDKCTVMGISCDVPPAVAITKTDLGEAPELSFYAKAFPLFLVSNVNRTGLDDLRGFLAGKTTVLLGPSGVGKSSLLNALDPALDLKVRAVSGRTGEGRHTTSWVEIVTVGVARIVDTPGIEFFDFWNLTPENVSACFPEFSERACRFRNCSHGTDSGCGVRAAVEAGEIAPSRHESYATIRRILRDKGVAFSPPKPPAPRKKEERPNLEYD